MDKYIISMEGKQSFSKEDLVKLSQNNISDGVLCVRNNNGDSIILKSNITIKLIKNCEQLKHK